MNQRGDQLLEHILAGGNGKAANELLSEFFHGYPIERLRVLLQSEKETICIAGAFIAAELAARITPLVGELSPLLDHPAPIVRSDILDAVLMGATSQHGEIVAKAVLLIRDPEEIIRWKAARLLARGTNEQLSAAIPHLDSSTDTKLLAWMLGSEGFPVDKQEVITRLAGPDPLVRLFAAAGAARLGPHDRVPLKHVVASVDPEISSYATKELDWLEYLEARQRRRDKRSDSGRTE